MKHRLLCIGKLTAIVTLLSVSSAWAQDAKECLTANQYRLVNHCPYPVSATWCVITNNPVVNCDHGFNMSDNIAPGGSTTLWPDRVPHDSITYTHFAGCKGTYNLTDTERGEELMFEEFHDAAGI